MITVQNMTAQSLQQIIRDIIYSPQANKDKDIGLRSH